MLAKRTATAPPLATRGPEMDLRSYNPGFSHITEGLGVLKPEQCEGLVHQEMARLRAERDRDDTARSEVQGWAPAP
eukprot:SAG22_NODE_9022_length_614_cov_1.015534_1_plen_76_part_00